MPSSRPRTAAYLGRPTPHPASREHSIMHAQPVNALTLENIQKQLESAAVEPFDCPLQWKPRTEVAQTLAKAI